MNNDLISRQAAIDALIEWYGCKPNDIEAFGKIIEALPSAQPIIRCRDCKNFGGGTYCYERDGMWNENDFCSYAERRPMSDCMTFPDTVEEFMKQYKVVDTDGIYMSKGAELVPIFRMRQWFEHLPSVQPNLQPTCNQLATGYISRQAAMDALGEEGLITAMVIIDRLPSAQPERKEGKWIPSVDRKENP